MREVGGICEMCMCLARGGVGGEWMRELSLGFTNPVERGGVLYVYLCCGSVGSGLGAWVQVWKGGVVLCLSGFFV